MRSRGWKNLSRGLLATGLVSLGATGVTCVEGISRAPSENRTEVQKDFYSIKDRYMDLRKIDPIPSTREYRNIVKTPEYRATQEVVERELETAKAKYDEIENSPQFIADEEEDTREFLSGFGRFLMLGSLTGGLFWLSGKARNRKETEERREATLEGGE